MLSLAVASGGLAASEVGERTAAVEERVGPLVPVVVRGRRAGAQVRIEVVDRGPGISGKRRRGARGLTIAEAAVSDAGGRLEAHGHPAIEIPVSS